MKYTIEGFSQAKAVELKLDLADLVILRWFVDFANTDRIIKTLVNNKVYFWIKYEGLLKELPILGITKDGLYRRLMRLVEKEVLEHTTVKQGGTYSMYRLGKAYESLVSDEYTGGTESIPTGYGNKSVGGTESIPEQNTNLLNNKSTKKKNTLPTVEEQAPEYKNYGEIYTDPINSEIRVELERFVKSLSNKHGYNPRVATVAKFADTLRKLSSNNKELAKRIVNQSIDNGWKDLYKLKDRHSRDAVSTPFNPEKDTLATGTDGKTLVY